MIGRNAPKLSITHGAGVPFAVASVRAAVVLGLCICPAAHPARAGAARRPVVALETGAATFVGAVLGRSQSTCFLMQRDGAIATVPLARVTRFRSEPDAFRPLTVSQFKTRLVAAHSREFAWCTTPRFVVGVQAGDPRPYAELLEDVYRRFSLYWSVRGLSLRRPEFPLAAIIHTQRPSFAQRCRDDRVPVDDHVYGYYHRLHNRIIAFIPDDDPNGLQTLRHEAVHQLAFNMGLHSRTGDQPEWVVEGLAMLFEATWDAARRSSRRERVNPTRLRDFRAMSHRPGLRELVAADTPFESRPLQAYAAAWALTFYLSETHSREYWAYLHELARQAPGDRLDGEERLRLFCKHFGNNLKLLEAAWLRFMDRL
ncbi:MAG: DUF1570 domain-containing protein [Planctomycetota bacterium]|nr:MAG: DUF1570 domain-containing protein [Planctomycetota bacterium]